MLIWKEPVRPEGGTESNKMICDKDNREAELQTGGIEQHVFENSGDELWWLGTSLSLCLPERPIPSGWLELLESSSPHGAHVPLIHSCCGGGLGHPGFPYLSLVCSPNALPPPPGQRVPATRGPFLWSLMDQTRSCLQVFTPAVPPFGKAASFPPFRTQPRCLLAQGQVRPPPSSHSLYPVNSLHQHLYLLKNVAICTLSLLPPLFTASLHKLVI